MGISDGGTPAPLSLGDVEAWPFEALAWDFTPTAFLPAATMGQALPRELREAIHIVGAPMRPPAPPYNLPPRRDLPQAKAAAKRWFSPGARGHFPQLLKTGRCRRYRWNLLRQTRR